MDINTDSDDINEYSCNSQPSTGMYVSLVSQKRRAQTEQNLLWLCMLTVAIELCPHDNSAIIM